MESLANLRLEFEKLIENPSIQPKDLIDFVDRNVSSPSLQHSNYLQLIWIRDCRWFMGQEENRNISEIEAAISYQSNLSDKFHIFYFLKYVVPVFQGIEKYRSMSEDDKEWAKSRIDRVSKIIAKNNLKFPLDIEGILKEIKV